MRAIVKGKEPRELTEFRSKPGSVYDDGSDFSSVKELLRQSLLEEQGYLCAYCMQRISDGYDKMKIEHWHSRTRYSREQLDYDNLLACCMGREGSPTNEQHCDTRKGERDLRLNPAKREHHARLKAWLYYSSNGTLCADASLSESEKVLLNQEIEDVLNLNSSWLKINRREVLKAVMDSLDLLRRNGNRYERELERLMVKFDSKNSERKYYEYCGIVVYYLERMLQKSSPSPPRP